MSQPVRDERLTLPGQGPELEMNLYCARPDDTWSYPAVVVIHEAFGVDAHIADLTRRILHLRPLTTDARIGFRTVTDEGTGPAKQSPGL